MHKAKLNRCNQTVLNHLHLAHQQAAVFSRKTGIDPSDLTQVGVMGLIKASRNYEKANNIPFEAFARPHVRGAILHYLRDSVALVKLPRRIEEEAIRLSRNGTESMSKNQQWILSLYRNKNRWQQLQSETATTDPNLGTIEDQDTKARVMDALRKLPRIEQQCVCMTVLEGMSLRQAARYFGVSAMTVQRRVKRGLKSMATTMGEVSPSLDRAPSASEALQWTR